MYFLGTSNVLSSGMKEKFCDGQDITECTSLYEVQGLTWAVHLRPI